MPMIAPGDSLPPGMFDCLVIGAGSAGSALAGRLAEKPGNRILVVEAGGSNRHLSVKLPARNLKLLDDPRFDWRYRVEPDPSRDGKVDLYYRGKGLGGSSSINGMVYVRGAPDDYDRWERGGAEGWGWDEVGPAFRLLEAPLPHGPRDGEGRLRTRKVQRLHRVTESFLAAAEAAGVPRQADYNDGAQEGVGPIELSQTRGYRHSSADAFLRPALANNGNLHVALGCEVDRINFDGLRAIGAMLRRGDRREQVRAAKVIVCAGSINTPKLLMLSGIGDAARLRSLGIEPLLDQPAVGANLREHPMVRLQYMSRITTFNGANKWHHALRHLATFARFGEGPIAGVFEGIGFVRSRPEVFAPDLQLHFLPIAVHQDASGKLIRSGRSGFTVYVNLSHPESTGRVDLVSADPQAAPRISYHLAGSDADVDRLVDGLALIQRIMTKPPIDALVDREVMPGFVVDADRDRARAYVRNAIEPGYHPIGTCAMGGGNDAVVSPRLALNGLDGLWIADASVMPDLISGNTNAACMMIGDRLGRWLRDQA